MEPVMRVLESLAVRVGVNLRGGDAGVAKHFLDDAQVPTILEEVGRETVTQRVRGEMLRNAGFAGVFLDQAPDRFRAEPRAAKIGRAHV